MPLMTWNESFSVGHALLDSDHQILVNLLNQLHDALDTGQSRDVVGSVVNVLAEYIEHHFRREEAILERVGYPQLEPHARQHRELQERFRDIRDRWRDGERTVLGEEVLDFLRRWLTDHILVSDKAYRPWVENTELGLAGEGAKSQ